MCLRVWVLLWVPCWPDPKTSSLERCGAVKLWVGGLRQAGVLAAAGKVSLLDMVGRLEEDHRNARTFAQGEQLMSFFMKV